MNLPDGMYLRVKYTYRVFGQVGKNLQLQNNAKLQSQQSDEIGSSGDNTNITINDSKAEFGFKGVTIYKVDADDLNKNLQGAVFKLSEYDPVTTEYKPFTDPETRDDKWVSDEKGTVKLGNLKPNTPYKLEEISPPEGYLKSKVPVFFYVYDASLKDSDGKWIEGAWNVPDNFEGIQVYEYGTLSVKNTSDMTQITVNKVWKDSDGTTDLKEAPNSPISVQLYRKKTADGEGELCKSVEIGPGNSWTHTFTGLSKTWVDESGTRQNYLYYVKEEPYSGYKTTYGNNDGINSSVNADGEVINPITITNTKSSSYALPNTGGPGAVMHMAGGLAIVSVSLLLLYIEIKHRRKGNASF